MAEFMQVPVQRRQRHFRHRDGLSLDLSDEELRQRYRFGREGILFVSNLLHDDLVRETNRNHSLSVEQQVMIALRFYASGSFLQVIGDTLGLDKSTVSRVVTAVTESLCRKTDDFIKWPCVEQTREDFYEIAGFPNVLGAVDGTHIRVQAPNSDEASFVNRKNFHSINVQGICDPQGIFCLLWSLTTLNLF